MILRQSKSSNRFSRLQSRLSPSLSKTQFNNEKLRSNVIPKFFPKSHNQKVKDQYLVTPKNQSSKYSRPDKSTRRKQSLASLSNQKFEQQLMQELKNLNQTLKKYENIEKQFIGDNTGDSNKKSRSTKNNLSPSFNSVELETLKERIKNRDLQIDQIKNEITALKQQIQNSQTHNGKRLDYNNYSSNQCAFTNQMKLLNTKLLNNIKQYERKLKSYRSMKQQINEAFQDRNDNYQRCIQTSDKSKTLLQKPIPYAQFRKIFLNKIKNQNKRQQTQSHKLGSKLGLTKSYKYSNISNVAVVIPLNFGNQGYNRQLLPGEIPELRKEKKPTIKSMNQKKKILIKALKSQQQKQDNQVAQLVNKFMFLRDEETYANEQIKHLQEQIKFLQKKFDCLDTRQKDKVNGKTLINETNRILSQSVVSQFALMQKNKEQKGLDDYQVSSNFKNMFFD